MKKKKYWESAQYSKLIDYYDFFNENLDKDIESVRGLVSDIARNIHKKKESKEMDFNNNQNNRSRSSNLVKELNHLLIEQHTKRIESNLSLEKIQQLIQTNIHLINSIQYISLNIINSDKKLRKLEKNREKAIHTKDFEKAAYYRDLISTFELLSSFHSISNEFETSSFFIYRENILYFVIKDHNPFNTKIRTFMENAND